MELSEGDGYVFVRIRLSEPPAGFRYQRKLFIMLRDRWSVCINIVDCNDALESLCLLEITYVYEQKYNSEQMSYKRK